MKSLPLIGVFGLIGTVLMTVASIFLMAQPTFDKFAVMLFLLPFMSVGFIFLALVVWQFSIWEEPEAVELTAITGEETAAAKAA
jgi:energy-coupling factor transporter transmembrane protein EcfT